MSSNGHHWLVKTEPDCFSIEDLAASPRQTTGWEGVRNYQARNLLKAMHVGDRVLIYHSSTEPLAVVGVAVVVHEAYPDSTAWDPLDAHYDPKSTPEDPIWEMVDLRLEETFKQPIPLDALHRVPALSKMELLRKGSRLSVQPVTEREFETIMKLAHAAAPRRAVKTKSAKKPARKPAARR
jgi:predicted RNA-binding protein with PUA-like domain